MGRTLLPLLVLMACRDQVSAPPSAPDTSMLAAVDATTTTTVTVTSTAVADVATASTVAPQARPDPDRDAAELARVRLVGRRRAVTADVAASTAEIDRLERRLKKVGPRNERIQLLDDLGKARREATTRRQIDRRCKEAFEGELGVELEETWALTEELGPDEAEAARDAYRRYVSLAADMQKACGPLEPLDTTEGRRIGIQ